MPRWLALEYDRNQARLAAVNVRGDQTIVEHLVAVSLGTDEDPGGALAAALKQKRISRAPTLVSIPRASVELKPLTLPPAPDEELPDMVRFQAMREFNTLGAEWPLDFLPLTTAINEPRQVLAAAISPETLGEVQKLCEKLNVEPQRIVLRPCAAASLFNRREEARRQAMCLLVDLLPGEADLTAVANGNVVFTRTARLALDVVANPEDCRVLISEVRRSLAAVHHQVGSGRVEAVYLWGDTPAHEEVAKRLAANLQLPVHTCPPLAGLQTGGETLTERPEHFVALLGALVDQVEEVRPTFDFLNPRKAPPPPSKARKMILVAAAAAVLVLGGMWLYMRALADLDQRIADAESRIRNTETMVKKAKEVQEKVDAIKAWQASNISWLDEMYYLSERSPDFRQAVLTRLQLSSHSAGGGDIQLEGLVQQSSDVDELERALGDEQHRVEGKSRQREPKSTRYAWRFRSQVLLAPRDDDPLTVPAEASPAAEVAADGTGEGNKAAEVSTSTPAVAPANPPAAREDRS